jgi:hypothetical protein
MKQAAPTAQARSRPGADSAPGGRGALAGARLRLRRRAHDARPLLRAAGGREASGLAALSLAASANRPTGLPEGVGPHGLWVWQAPRDGQENGLREAAPPTPRLSALMAASEALAVL